MNFITFPAAATNVFPMANTSSGGQLVTEFNLKSRESIPTDSNVTYNIGPSYVHSLTDFEVSVLEDSGGAIVNPYTLSISEGRGVINGHFVETLAPMTIDLLEANINLAAQSRKQLKGKLAIGIRTFFATEQTIAGSMLVENDEDMFLGIQLVVLPEEEMITPSGSPSDQSKVTCDILLATFTFNNDVISGVSNSKTKIQFLNSDRIKDIDSIVSERYVTKTGLNSKKLYAFAGKGTDPSTGIDTWEDITDSTMIWDASPSRITTKPIYKEAQIVTTTSNSYLVIPHKQVEGMTTDEGDPEYYAPKVISLPVADYVEGTAGLVNKSYTNQIKAIAEDVSKFRSTLTGKQIYYMASRTVDDQLPPINEGWDYGDYILVGIDEYYTGGAGDESQSPATMYVVLPGQVSSIQYISSLDGDATTEPGIPDNVWGVELGFQEWYESAGQSEPDTEHPEYYPEFFNSEDVMRGIPYSTSENKYYDYFRVRYYREENPEDGQSYTYPFTDYFYGVSKSGAKEWSDVVLVTGEMPFATEEVIGGFLNASEDATDYGYVYLDDTGHLRLRDYSLLRSGTLAYQISTSITIPSSDDYTELQANLNDYVNERVAFPASSNYTGNSPVIDVYLTLPASESAVTLTIAGIDSRFNTAICLHIDGEAGSNVTLNIYDCEKIMIDPDISGSPVINMCRCCLYYDTIVIGYIRTCERDSVTYGSSFYGFQDMTLWYEQINSGDPAIVVNGMTVSEVDSPVITSDINYWKELGSAANDNHYRVALKSLSYSSGLTIVGCEILVANNSTDNVLPGHKIIVGECELPQGDNLRYPVSCLTKVLKVAGSFTSAYCSDETWYVTDNSFTFETGAYTTELATTSLTGTIAFHSNTTLIPTTISQTSISPWEPDTFNVFRGGAIS